MNFKPRNTDSIENRVEAALLSMTALGSFILEAEIWLSLLLWLAAAYIVVLAFKLTRRGSSASEATSVYEVAAIPDAVAQVMTVKEAKEQNGVLFYTGELKEDPDIAYRKLKDAYDGQAIPMLQETWSGKLLILIPGQIENLFPRYKTRPLLHIGLAVITIISTTFAGARHLGYHSLTSAAALWAGLSYALPLLAILGIHECGHFVVARAHGMVVTPPFFIPVPFGLGTLGALIQVKSPAMNRKSLFDMAVAGPLAGFIVSIPALLIGLQNSIIVHPITPKLFMTGSFWQETPVSGSILLSFLASIARGEAIHYGDILTLSPLALAGWIGLWVTAFNLLPIGQLDGGHVSQSMFGSNWSMVLTRLAMILLFVLSIYVWPGFLVWLIILWIVARQTVPPINDVTPINQWRMLLGWFAMSLIILILCPMPQL